MKTLNKIVTTFLLLALIPIVTAALIVPRETIELLRDGLDQLESGLPASMSAGRLAVGVALALVIDGLLVFLLYLQVRRRPLGAVAVQQTQDGKAQIAVDSVVGRLKYHVDRLPGVLSVEPKVTARRRGVEVILDVETSADVNVPAMIEQISSRARQVVESEMGLRLKGRPQLNLRTVTLPAPSAEPYAGAATPGAIDFSAYADDEDEPLFSEGRVDEPGSAVPVD